MNLDDLTAFTALDLGNMYAQIENLPHEILPAWDYGSRLVVPKISSIQQVLICGMGTSALGAELAVAAVRHSSRIAIMIHRDYNLPSWVSPSQTLIIAFSHSGNTEEVLSAFEQAILQKIPCLAITTGGKLAILAKDYDRPIWEYAAPGITNSSLGYISGILLAALYRLDLAPNLSSELATAVEILLEQQAGIGKEIPAVRNPAKRVAGQLVGRWPTIISSVQMLPAALNWKNRINKLAKTRCSVESLPEVDHNSLAGIEQPGEIFPSTLTLFLRAPSDLPRNRLRSELTRKFFMLQGLPTDYVDARGDTALANLWSCLHFGDYVAYYLAMAYGIDPAAPVVIEEFKKEMAGSAP